MARFKILKNRIGIIVFLLLSLVLAAPVTFAQAENNILSEGSASDYGCTEDDPLCAAHLFAVSAEKIADIQVPGYAAPSVQSATVEVTYRVESRGILNTSIDDFKQLAGQTLNDLRGWAKLGIKFVEVESGGDFSLVLSEASQVAAFSPGCSAEYSCNVGRYVIINQDRWNNATPAWNSSGGNLRDYRHMVVNHETGHWLGHGHRNCGGAGQPAPVMQQQSIDLQGCKFNPWPLPAELYSPRLGI